MAKKLEIRVRDDEFPMDTAVAEALTSLAAGDHPRTKESMLREIRAMADELVGPGATVLECRLGMTAAICWFMMRFYELQSLDDWSMRFANGAIDHQRRIGAVHGRYLKTLKELRRVQSRYDLRARRRDEEEDRRLVEELLANKYEEPPFRPISSPNGLTVAAP